LTTHHGDPSVRAAIIAAAAAGVLMLVSGASYRVVAARLAAPTTTTPIDPCALERFPLQIGGWVGQDVPMDEAIARATDTDARINRRYARHGGLEAVSFYVASGVKARDLMPHRPEVCYTGAGWTLVDRHSVELPLSDGTALPCNVLQFSRGILSTQRVTVLNYYIVDGQYCRDVSRLRFKAWRGSGAVRYVAQVQITTAILEILPADSAETLICTFAVDSALPVARLFHNSNETQGPDGPREPLEGE